MTDLERIQAAALSQQITLEQYARQVFRDPGGYSRRTVATVREIRDRLVSEFGRAHERVDLGGECGCDLDQVFLL